ncbi:hypothetical protein SAMN06265338_104194 [Rhodoblastus acidophilus]|uniref:Uncharacterized protein n=1 Tax=Rhodoblastus acidophilus TaxID=1074 RepID=A0A212RGY9_RHOAC|nr:hypothetical protein [Rhodoblastus acidophilus]PPQ39568.1 hypothetical protein CKO16_04825 [Rhodoblastus acidophilus]RAI24351.1 hypothetical protein CH337_00205 [Rhodoblastus acidophilus]SNB71683.1 hypothetical protein SAMN06265338_104194 [Rhodoblastus acidophilus]
MIQHYKWDADGVEMSPEVEAAHVLMAGRIYSVHLLVAEFMILDLALRRNEFSSIPLRTGVARSRDIAVLLAAAVAAEDRKEVASKRNLLAMVESSPSPLQRLSRLLEASIAADEAALRSKS